MKSIRDVVLVSVVFLLAGCAALPPVVADRAASPSAGIDQQELDLLFPAGAFQFVHSLELTLPGNHSAMLMGVLNISSHDRSIHCVVMTLEGLVLFEADDTGDSLVIERGVPPFDSREFAAGLIRDIRLIFFRPGGRLLESGFTRDEQRLLRYSGTDFTTTDVIRSPDRKTWNLSAYDSSNRLVRSVLYDFRGAVPMDTGPRFPGIITLTAGGRSGYTLTMTLLDVHFIH